VKDAAGEDVPTYTNTDILSMARAWTGFTRPTPRPNLENRWGGSENLMDPMVRTLQASHSPGCY
jgi:hypothetical protein